MKSSSRISAPKKFTSTFKLLDVVASPFGTHADGFTRHSLHVSLTDMPIWTNLHSLFRQHAITGVKLTYRPTITAYTSEAGGSIAAPQLLYAEDKNNFTPLSPFQVRSQDNCKTLMASRGWSKYVAKPRPNLFQSDATLGVAYKTISKAQDIHWLSPALSTDPESTLPHLMAQFCVQDVTGAVNDVGIGELWAKVYVVCKEQSRVNAL